MAAFSEIIKKGEKCCADTHIRMNNYGLCARESDNRDVPAD
jgi:hypothetical protein